MLSLRRRLQDAPKRVRTLEERLLETKGQLSQAVSQNEKLTYTLREARDHIAALREEVDKLTQPPSAYGTVVGAQRRRHGRRVHRRPQGARRGPPRAGRRAHPAGAEVVLNESLNVVLSRAAELTGEVVIFKERLDGNRALIVGRADEERVVELVDELLDVKLRNGDTVLLDPRSGLVLEKLPRPEVEELVPRGGPRHRLRRHRRPRRADRADRRRGGAARSCTRTCSSSTSCRRRRASSSTALRAAARRSSPRRSPTASPRRWPR